MTDTSRIRDLLGPETHSDGEIVIWKTDRVSLKRMNALLALDEVEDVNLLLVPDLTESWDGEPYNTQFLVQVDLKYGVKR